MKYCVSMKHVPHKKRVIYFLDYVMLKIVSERKLSYMCKYESEKNACEKIHNPNGIFTCSNSTMKTTGKGVEYV